MDDLAKCLVLGLGNTLMGDDGLGVVVAEKLNQSHWPMGVKLEVVGTSIINYLGAISKYRHIIVVDALRAGGKPGSIYRLSLEEVEHHPEGWRDSHGCSLPDVIALARGITGLPKSVIIYGVEPEDLGFGSQLSPAVQAALPKVIERVAQEIISGQCKGQQ